MAVGIIAAAVNELERDNFGAENTFLQFFLFTKIDLCFIVLWKPTVVTFSNSNIRFYSFTI